MADFIVDEPAAPTPLAQDARGLHVTTHETYDSPGSLSPTNVDPDPLEQFRKWFTAAQGVVREPEAMSVSTSTPEGVPSSRFVLLKDVTPRGFVFYTNYTSRKSAELASNPHAALALYWRETHQQVRVVGRVHKVDPEESAAYFKSRPVGSRVGAWASHQSSVVGEGQVRARLDKLEERFGVKNDAVKSVDVPAPDFWGGWLVIPDEVEFWAGKPSRLHDRVRYLRTGEDASGKPTWKIERLAP